MAKEPQRSQWIKLKGAEEIWVLLGKGSLFCFEKWQTSQHVVLLKALMFTTRFNNWSLENEGCSSLVCHNSMLEKGLVVAVRAVDLCWYEKSNRYKPLLSLPWPIMLHWARSWMKQQLPRKMRQQNEVLVSLLTEIRLKAKDGTHNTSFKTKVEEICIMPTCVTKTWSPFGK